MTDYPRAKLNWLPRQMPGIIERGKIHSSLTQIAAPLPVQLPSHPPTFPASCSTSLCRRSLDTGMLPPPSPLKTSKAGRGGGYTFGAPRKCVVLALHGHHQQRAPGHSRALGGWREQKVGWPCLDPRRESGVSQPILGIVAEALPAPLPSPTVAKAGSLWTLPFQRA